MSSGQISRDGVFLLIRLFIQNFLSSMGGLSSERNEEKTGKKKKKRWNRRLMSRLCYGLVLVLFSKFVDYPYPFLFFSFPSLSG